MRVGLYLVIGLWAGEVAPFLDDSAEVDRVERYQDGADLVVLGETIEVEDVEHERLGTDFCVRHLKRTRKRYKR